MLPFATRGLGEPTLVMMAFLGGSHHEWSAVVERLRDRFRCVGIDMPGFGDAADVPGYSVEEMAEAVTRTLRELDLRRFVLVGHSMSGKVTAVLARRRAEGEMRLRGLEGVVLVAPSPVEPEPMTDRKRSTLLTSLGQVTVKDHAHAVQYIRDNSSDDVPAELFDALVADVERMNRGAWRAWLESGSREDWAERVGLLGLPALVVAGDKDGSLGPEVQRGLTMPHWPYGRLATLHANHLIPAEKPAELARLIAEFAAQLGDPDAPRPPRREIEVEPEYQALIRSNRVSAATRAVLDERAEPDDLLRAPEALSLRELTTLRALVDRIVPQRRPAIDVGARIDRELAHGAGDGWRYAALPADVEAYRAGLATLDWHAQRRSGMSFLALGADAKDDLLREAETGGLGKGLLVRLEAVVGLVSDLPRLNAEAMQRWFEDVRGDATRVYMAHPATLAAIGYSGIADGENSATMQGFVQLGPGAVEPWEPEAKTAR